MFIKLISDINSASVYLAVPYYLLPFVFLFTTVPFTFHIAFKLPLCKPEFYKEDDDDNDLNQVDPIYWSRSFRAQC